MSEKMMFAINFGNRGFFPATLQEVAVKVTFITAYEQNVTEKIAGVSSAPLILPKPTDSTKAVASTDRVLPGVHIEMGPGSRSAISINNQASFNELEQNQLPLNAVQLQQIFTFTKQLMAESDEDKLKAVQLLLGVATSKNDPETQRSAIQSFRQWLSTVGDHVKEGLKTSAAIVSVATPVLKILGLL